MRPVVPWLLLLAAASGAAGMGPCSNRDLGDDVTSRSDGSAPADGPAPGAGADADPRNTPGPACGPGLPPCQGGLVCKIEASCLPPEQRRGVCGPSEGQVGCPGVFLELCGCDRRTYQACDLPGAGVLIDHTGPCVPDPDPLACTTDDDCTLTPYDKPVRATADCYCTTGCGDARSKAAAAANMASWQRHCPEWQKSQRCIIPPCPPPSPIGCRARRCTWASDGCHGALQKRQRGAAPASCTHPGRCAQIEKQPDRRVTFRLVLRKINNGVTVSAADRQRNWGCVAELLRDRGTQVLPYDGLGDVNVVGTWAQIQDALALDIVVEVEPGCESTEVCRECAVLSTAACAADAFCQVSVGRRIDTARGCALGTEPIGCDPAGRSCPPVILFAADPNGVCFQINSGCPPANFQARAGCQPPTGGEYQPCP